MSTMNIRVPNIYKLYIKDDNKYLDRYLVFISLAIFQHRSPDDDNQNLHIRLSQFLILIVHKSKKNVQK